MADEPVSRFFREPERTPVILACPYCGYMLMQKQTYRDPNPAWTEVAFCCAQCDVTTDALDYLGALEGQRW